MKTVEIKDRVKIDEVISKCNICFLSTINEDGTPYCVPMNFGYIGNEIYLHSAPNGKMYDNVVAKRPISLTFCTDCELVYMSENVACSYRMRSASVIVNGDLFIVDELENKVNALNTMMQHYTTKDFHYREPALKNVFVFKISIKDISCKAFGVPYKESLKM